MRRRERGKETGREGEGLKEAGGRAEGVERVEAGGAGGVGRGRARSRPCNNYVWVQANMRQLPAGQAVLFSAAKRGGRQQFPSAPRMHRAKVGASGAGGSPRGGF